MRNALILLVCISMQNQLLRFKCPAWFITPRSPVSDIALPHGCWERSLYIKETGNSYAIRRYCVGGFLADYTWLLCVSLVPLTALTLELFFGKSVRLKEHVVKAHKMHTSC